MNIASISTVLRPYFVRCFVLSIVVVLLSSCQNEPAEQVNSMVVTRAMTNNGQLSEFGLHILSDGVVNDPYSYLNCHYAMQNDGRWHYTGSTSIESRSPFSTIVAVAYAPYRVDASYPQMNVGVESNQSTAQGYAASDFVYARRPNMRASDELSLDFSHKFAALTINIEQRPSVEEFEVVDMKIIGRPFTGQFDMQEGMLSLSTNRRDITPLLTTPLSADAALKARFSAVVMPQSVAEGELLFEINLTVAGKAVKRSVYVSSSFEFEAGSQYVINISPLDSDNIEIESSMVIVSPWPVADRYSWDNQAGLVTMDANTFVNLSDERRKLLQIVYITGNVPVSLWAKMITCTNLRFFTMPEGTQVPASERILTNRTLAAQYIPYADLVEKITVRFLSGELPYAGESVSRLLKSLKNPVDLTCEANGEFATTKDIFRGCMGIRSATMVYFEDLADGTFADCSNLESINILSIFLKIGNEVFAGCSKIRELTLGVAVSSIGDAAMRDMPKLEVIKLNSKTVNLRPENFGGTTNTQNIDLYIKETTGVVGNTLNGVTYKSIQTW